MKCSVCGHEMVQSKIGWLCSNCGHSEKIANPAVSSAASTAPSPVVSAVPTAVTSARPTPTQAPTATPVSLMASTEVHPAASVVGVPTPTPHKSRKKLYVILAAGAAVLIPAVVLAKMFFYDPQNAPAAYWNRVINAKTGQFAANASATSSSGESIINGTTTLKASGSYDLSKPSTPQGDIKLALEYEHQTLSGEIITVPKTVYFKIDQLGFLSNLGFTLSKDWYKLPIEEESTTKCDAKHSKSGSYFGLSVPKSLPLKNTRRVGLFETIDGHMTSHFAGQLDNSKLQKYIDDANKELSADCKISISADEFKDTAVTYDIWSGNNFDRAQFKFVNSKNKDSATLTIDSSHYNQPVKVNTPSGAKEIKDLFSAFGGDDTSASSPGTGSGPQGVRDSQRKSDLRNVKTALETYYNDIGNYPSGDYAGLTTILTTGTTPYLVNMPSDPTAGQKYSYVPGDCGSNGCQTYQLKATLENKSDSQASGGVYTVDSAN